MVSGYKNDGANTSLLPAPVEPSMRLTDSVRAKFELRESVRAKIGIREVGRGKFFGGSDDKNRTAGPCPRNYISSEKFLKSRNFPPSPAGARSTPLNQPSAEEKPHNLALLGNLLSFPH
jgi:hypothetical protein